MKEAFRAFEFGLTEMCFPSLGFRDISINKRYFLGSIPASYWLLLWRK